MYWIVIIAIGILASLSNIAHVLVGVFNSRSGAVYLWTGHYHLDYYAYLQIMAQGIRGHWLVENPYDTGDFTKTFFGWWPDLIFGKLAGIFNLSPILFYWLSVALFSFILVILIYLVIEKMMIDQPRYLRLLGFLFVLFSAPFFRLEKTAGGLQIITHDFWYFPSVIFKRLGGVPRHLLDQILILVAVFILTTIIKNLSTLQLKTVFLKSVIISIILVILLSFSPHTTFVLLAAIFLTVFFFLLSRSLDKSIIIRFLVLLTTISIFVLPAIYAIKIISSGSGMAMRCAAWDAQQISFPLPSIFLAIGPMVLFCPFGLLPFFRSASPMRTMLFFLSSVSMFLFLTSVSSYVGLGNFRFVTPLIYPFIGVSSVLGIEKLASLVPRFRKTITITVSVLLLFLSGVSNYGFFGSLLSDPNIYTSYSYLSLDIIDGLSFLETDKTPGAVLTPPNTPMGMIVPIFTTRRVYSGRELLTDNFAQKSYQSLLFFDGKMETKDASKLLVENKISFVFWISQYGGSSENLSRYDFLHPIFRNQKVIIFKMINI